MMGWLLAGGVALGSPTDDLVEDIGRGLVVDWSTLVVEVDAGSYRAGAQATKAVEQSARGAIDDRLEQGLQVLRWSLADTEQPNSTWWFCFFLFFNCHEHHIEL